MKRHLSEKSWNVIVIGCTVGILALIAIFTAVVDPFFHFHKPLGELQYPMQYERYQNDGITRHYEYNGMITGTSMTQNFKASEAEQLWGGTFIKASYSGASFYEIDQAVRRAFSYNADLKTVIRSLDVAFIAADPYHMEYEGYPEYLYDNIPFNDVNYLLNKEVFTKTLAVFNYTKAGNQTSDFDEYANWNQYHEFGRESVFRGLTIYDQQESMGGLAEKDKQQIIANVTMNVVATAEKYPETTFYVFFPPYSICYWGAMVRTGQMERALEEQETAIQTMIGTPNIKIFSFMDCFDIATDLNNYTDTLHYGEWINSEILQFMHAEEHLLTADNYEEYLQKIEKYYSSYDYDSLYAGKNQTPPSGLLD